MLGNGVWWSERPTERYRPNPRPPRIEHAATITTPNTSPLQHYNLQYILSEPTGEHTVPAHLGAHQIQSRCGTQTGFKPHLDNISDFIAVPSGTCMDLQTN